MRWPWHRWLHRAQDGQPAAVAHQDAVRKLHAAQLQRDEVRRAAVDLASMLEQAMRRPQ